ncbi:phage head-tail joining protein [Maritalea porphyrae]|uniref:phage head-tail joining protein n=1 Tax=Maritalea porphyrae TaxID=880732 RepID=UPI0022AF4B86|nr:hypothetical protein [Maritalea porphyrae]MCZ4274000.1 hypothetical protein [Maritalea porphyrae]
MNNWTEADLKAIDEAIALGAFEVEFTNHRVKYRSLADMLHIRKLIATSLGIADQNARPTTTFAVHSRD